MKNYTVDRIEDKKIAVLLLRENESIERHVDINLLPVQIREGDIIAASFYDDGSVNEIKVLKNDTASAKQTAEDLLKKILDKNK